MRATLQTGMILLVTAGTLAAQVKGKMFPQLSGETLDGQSVNLPADTKGKYTLIGMAYSKQAEDNLKTWMNPTYNKFILKTGMLDSELDVYLYFIPMFVGADQVISDKVKKKVKDDTDKKLHPHVIFFKGSLKQYKDELGFDDKGNPYFFVLDKKGKIAYTTQGRYSDKKMEEIEDILLK